MQVTDFYKEFRDNDYPLFSLAEQFNRLPIGVETSDGSILRDLVPRVLSRTELKMIQDERYSRNNPMAWLARLICLVTDSIGKVPVYTPYAQSGFEEIPEIVRELPLSDTSYIVFVGHIHNFGWSIKNVHTTCIDELCGKKQVHDVDLRGLMVEYSEAAHHHLLIKFKRGLSIQRKGEETKKDLYTSMSMTIPLLKHALKYERYYRPNDQGDFYERIYGDCIESILQENGEPLEDERIRAIATPTLKNMSGEDSAILEGVLNSTPALLIMVKKQCNYCSEDLPIIVSQSFLYPKRR